MRLINIRICIFHTIKKMIVILQSVFMIPIWNILINSTFIIENYFTNYILQIRCKYILNIGYV